MPEIFAKFQFGPAVGSTVTAGLTRQCSLLRPGTLDERRPKILIGGHAKESAMGRVEAVDGPKAKGKNQLAWLDGLMNGRDSVGGNSIGLADIILAAWISPRAWASPFHPSARTSTPGFSAWINAQARGRAFPRWEQVGMRG
ncbi:MAG: glutathione S-transferase domain-containing protein [Porticoccaceae bacterium]